MKEPVHSNAQVAEEPSMSGKMKEEMLVESEIEKEEPFLEEYETMKEECNMLTQVKEEKTGDIDLPVLENSMKNSVIKEDAENILILKPIKNEDRYEDILSSKFPKSNPNLKELKYSSLDDEALFREIQESKYPIIILRKIKLNEEELEYVKNILAREKPKRRRKRRNIFYPKTFFCKLCPYAARKNSSFQIHLRKHAGLYVMPYQCRLCSFSAAKMSQLRLHSVQHATPKKFKCSKCSSTFNSKDKLNYHKQVHLQKAKKITRKERNSKRKNSHRKSSTVKASKTTSPKTLSVQLSPLKVSRNRSKTFLCNYCSFCSQRMLAVQAHVIKSHLSYYMCGVCGFVTQKVTLLKRHNKQALHGMSYQCRDCRYSNTDLAQLKSHVKMCMKKRSMTLCPSLVSKHSGHKKHWSVHVRNWQLNTASEYKCDLCSHLALSKLTLKIHYQKNHAEETKCLFCPFTSALRSKLRTHLQTQHFISCS